MIDTPVIGRILGSSRSDYVVARWELLVFSAIAAAVAFQLFVPPIVGVADNGDYHRVMTPLGLEPTVTEWSDRYFDHLNLRYRIGEPGPTTFPTSQILLGKAALAVNRWLGRGPLFSLQVLGGVNTAVYLLGLYLVLLAMKRLTPAARIAGGLVLFLISTDGSNVTFFNSFYSESASLVFLVLLIGWFLFANRRERVGTWRLVGYFLVAGAFVAAKPQNHPLAVPAVVIAAVWWRRVSPVFGRGVLVGGGALLLAFSWTLYSGVPSHIKDYNCWNVVFYSLLADSNDPRADLAELGLDPELASFAGQGAFAAGVPLGEVSGRIHHTDLARFFARHPDRLAGLAAACSREVYVKVDPVNGHFEKASGFPARQQSGAFSAWHRFQATVLPRSLGWLVLQWVVFTGAVGTVLYRRGAGGSEGAIAWLAGGLGLMAALEFVICVLGDGTYDIVKHLFLFQVLLDACFLIGLVWLIDLVEGVLRKPAARG